jgi:hypothetical protein
MDGSHRDERLFVVTPVAVEPEIVAAMAADRIRWVSFTRLYRSVEESLKDEAVSVRNPFCYASSKPSSSPRACSGEKTPSS